MTPLTVKGHTHLMVLPSAEYAERGTNVFRKLANAITSNTETSAGPSWKKIYKKVQVQIVNLTAELGPTLAFENMKEDIKAEYTQCSIYSKDGNVKKGAVNACAFSKDERIMIAVGSARA